MRTRSFTTAFVVKSGNTYHALTKNQTAKYIELDQQQPHQRLGSPGTVSSCRYEGPALVRMDSGHYRIYVDKYTNGGIWTATSSDLAS